MPSLMLLPVAVSEELKQTDGIALYISDFLFLVIKHDLLFLLSGAKIELWYLCISNSFCRH